MGERYGGKESAKGQPSSPSQKHFEKRLPVPIELVADGKYCISSASLIPVPKNKRGNYAKNIKMKKKKTKEKFECSKTIQ